MIGKYYLACQARVQTSQQVGNAVGEWLGGMAGSPARFQTLILLWAAGGRPVPHQEIIAALRVKRATVSALMFSLEQDGLGLSVPDRQDRRRLLATLTSKGEKVATDSMDLNAARLEQVMHDFSPEDLDQLQKLLRRVREDFTDPGRDGRVQHEWNTRRRGPPEKRGQVALSRPQETLASDEATDRRARRASVARRDAA